MKWEDGRIGQEIILNGEKGTIAILDAEDRLFFVQFAQRSTWVFPSMAESAEPVISGKYEPGEKGWIPDRMEDGIDVLAITEELVAVEVGK
jgi:hypothetical protein